jgi:hypothetical protein
LIGIINDKQGSTGKQLAGTRKSRMERDSDISGDFQWKHPGDRGSAQALE